MPREFALPGTSARHSPDRRWDLQHVKIDLDVDLENRSIEGTTTLDLVAVSATRVINLDAIELDVAKVTVGRKSVRFNNTGRALTIELAKPARKGQTIKVAVTYKTTPRRGLYFIAPDETYPDKRHHAWSQGQDDDSPYWFPCIDRPSMKSTSEVIVRVAPEYAALSNGRLVSDKASARVRTIHWRFDVPHSCYLITLVVGDFSVIHAKHKNVDINYWVEPGREADCKRTLAKTPKMIDAFSKLFGVAYPYDSYTQIFVSDFIFGGMENTTATTLTDTVLIDARAALDFDIERLVAHELAHQWFGDLITCREWGEGWLNEGFATYSEYLWREHSGDADEAWIELDGWAQGYFDEDRRRYRRTVSTRMYEVPLDVFDAHLYNKGGRILHMLRNYLGDDDFFASLRHYLEKHRHGAVETSDLSRAIEEETGRAVDWFFDQWIVKGAGHPELDIELSWDGEKKLMAVRIEQSQEVTALTPVFRLPLTARFRVGRSDHDVELDVREARRTHYIPLASEPKHAIVDVGKPTLAVVRCKKSQPLWIAELAGAKTAADRIDAARALGRLGGADAIAALRRSLAKDPFWGVSAEAARALGQIRAATARDALLASLPKAGHRVRRAIVTALESFRHDGKAGDALATIVSDGDPSYFVEAAAALALGRSRVQDAGDTIVAASERNSWGDIIRREAFAGLAELGDVSFVDALLDATTAGRISRGRGAAAVAAARLTRHRGDHHSRRVRERLEELLWDADFRVQGAAVEALGLLGDVAAVGALEALAARDLDGRLRRRSRELCRDLREGTARAAEMDELRQSVDELRRTTTVLQDRVAALEAGGSVGKGAKRRTR